MNYKYIKKSQKDNIYICDYEKAKKLISLLNLNDVAKENKIFSVKLLNITVILYKKL